MLNKPNQMLSGVPKYLLCWPVLVCAGVFTAISAMYFQSTSYWWLAIAPVALSFFMLCRSIPDSEIKPGSPWTHLFINTDHLHVEQHVIAIEQINTVFLHRQQDRAVLQLPYNSSNGAIPEIQFCSLYFPAVEAFLRLRIPNVRICILPTVSTTEKTL